MATENNRDGIRRYEDLIRDAEIKAQEALDIAISGVITGKNAILSIAHGGTGSDTKNFVDTTSNQFDILGSKIFKASCGFLKESDIVDSGEIAGNIRLISCDLPGADIGPQLRFSGRHTADDLTPFAFATLAGRKENSTDGSKAGYFQLATTNDAGTIIEALRANSEQNVGIGAIPVIGSGIRLHLSGGNVFVDNVGGLRTIGLQISETIGRIQAILGSNYESLVIGVNADYDGNTCSLDNVTNSFGTAFVEVMADNAGATVPGGLVRFWTGGPGICPSLRGFFYDGGLDVIGEEYVSENIIAGGISNIVNGVGYQDATAGYITGENIKFGSGAPEGVVFARIGAIYGRTPGGGSDDPGENSTLWLKVHNDGGNTGWLPVTIGTGTNICIQEGCPDLNLASDGTMVPSCPVWFDKIRNMWFYWDSNVLRASSPDRYGAWLSTNTFQATSAVCGRSHTQQFKGSIDKDYEYLTPLRISRERLNVFLVDLTASLRVSNNGSDPHVNYYTFDLVTLMKRQGDPVANQSTKQEWPGDREPFENNMNNLRGFGHTYYENLRNDLIALYSTTPNGPDPVIGVGTVSDKRTNRRVLVDTTKTWVADQWEESDNDDLAHNLPKNNGFMVRMVTGNYAGVERAILSNTPNTLVLRSTWPRLVLPSLVVVTTPDAGDQYEILDIQYKKIIARISTKGNVYPDGAHINPDLDRNTDPPPLYPEYSLDADGSPLTASQVKSGGAFKTDDVQDFVRSIKNGLTSNHAGGDSDPDTHFINLDLYIDLFGADGDPVDAVILAGLWDAVRSPGKVSGAISVTYRLALPPGLCGST